MKLRAESFPNQTDLQRLELIAESEIESQSLEAIVQAFRQAAVESGGLILQATVNVKASLQKQEPQP